MAIKELINIEEYAGPAPRMPLNAYPMGEVPGITDQIEDHLRRHWLKYLLAGGLIARSGMKKHAAYTSALNELQQHHTNLEHLKAVKAKYGSDPNALAAFVRDNPKLFGSTVFGTHAEMLDKAIGKMQQNILNGQQKVLKAGDTYSNSYAGKLLGGGVRDTLNNIRANLNQNGVNLSSLPELYSNPAEQTQTNPAPVEATAATATQPAPVEATAGVTASAQPAPGDATTATGATAPAQPAPGDATATGATAPAQPLPSEQIQAAMNNPAPDNILLPPNDMAAPQEPTVAPAPAPQDSTPPVDPKDAELADTLQRGKDLLAAEKSKDKSETKVSLGKPNNSKLSDIQIQAAASGKNPVAARLTKKTGEFSRDKSSFESHTDINNLVGKYLFTDSEEYEYSEDDEKKSYKIPHLGKILTAAGAAALGAGAIHKLANAHNANARAYYAMGDHKSAYAHQAKANVYRAVDPIGWVRRKYNEISTPSKQEENRAG